MKPMDYHMININKSKEHKDAVKKVLPVKFIISKPIHSVTSQSVFPDLEHVRGFIKLNEKGNAQRLVALIAFLF